MLATARHGGRCIYCAFRAHQLHLQSLRTRRLHLQSTPSRLNESIIRYTNEDGRGDIYIPPVHHSQRKKKRRPQVTFTEDNRKVRKYTQNDDLDSRNVNFETALRKRLQAIKYELVDSPLLEQLRKENEAGKAQSFAHLWGRFSDKILGTWSKASYRLRPPFDDGEALARLMRELHRAYSARGQNGLDLRLKYEFYAHVTNARFTPSDIANQKAVADLRYPSEWYPATRSLRRTIHLHVGPTNSGKTYHALRRLEEAEHGGIYAGPLRLLAHEVYTRMNAKGIPCALVTGDERRVPEQEDTETPGEKTAGTMACTVEMMPLNSTVDVAVIDEIQMIGNAERGWAWTQALLGAKAREVHLCGEERTVPLIRSIAASLGEPLEIHRYERLSPLRIAEASLEGDLTRLRKGDCVVSFSIMGIHSLRQQIERSTGRKVATVYGSLPPETRAQQARLFNDPDNEYDFLVASDAVGMGLNLAIKRIIFESSAKYDGYQHHTLPVADIKQIAGRAGRYRTADQATQSSNSNSEQDLSAAKSEPDPPPLLQPSPAETTSTETTGYVTTLQPFDFPIVSTAMSSEPDPIRSAGLFPPAVVLERFANYFPPLTPFSYILTRLHELSQMHSRFHLCGLKDQVWIADLIEPVRGLTIADRNIICSAPASISGGALFNKLMPALARCIAEQTGGGITDIPELPLEVLERADDASAIGIRELLRELEMLHKGIVVYLWLSYRFAGVFGQRNLAFAVKGLVEDRIEKTLARFSFTENAYKRARVKREEKLKREMEMGDPASATDWGAKRDEEAEVEAEAGAGLREQTSLTAGGDRFGGEEGLGFEDPVMEEAEEEDDQGDGMVADLLESMNLDPMRRNDSHPRTTPPLTQISTAAEDNEALPVSDAQHDNFEAADHTARSLAPDAIVDLPPVDQISLLPAQDVAEALSPEQDPSDIITPITPETELEHPPLQTQEEAPVPTEARTPEEGELSPQKAGNTEGKPFDMAGESNMPHKHLPHLKVEATEVGRDVGSRP